MVIIEHFKPGLPACNDVLELYVGYTTQSPYTPKTVKIDRLRKQWI